MLFRKPNIVHNMYEKLPGTPRDYQSGAQRLYLGPNHLLILELKGSLDKARRFYYTDITAVRQVVTIQGRLIDAAFVAAALAAWVLAMYTEELDVDVDLAVFAGFVTAIAVIALAVNAFRGPTCRVWLHTTNHTELLSGLDRYRVASQALAQIHTRVAAAQDLAEIESPAETLPPFSPYAPPPMPERPHAARIHDPRLMRFAFYCSLALASLSLIGLAYTHVGVDAVSVWCAFAIAMTGPVGIIRSFGTDCPKKARQYAVALLGFVTLLTPFAILLFAVLVLLGFESLVFEETPLGSSSDPVTAATNLVAFAVHAVCGFAGLRALHRGNEKTPETPE